MQVESVTASLIDEAQNGGSQALADRLNNGGFSSLKKADLSKILQNQG